MDEKRQEGVSIVLDLEVYPLEVIYAASYVILENIYIRLEKKDSRRVIVTLIPKYLNYDLDRVKGEFYNGLLNYAFHQKQFEKTKEIREILLQRALLTNTSSINKKDKFEKKKDEETNERIDKNLEESQREIEERFSGDPEKIIPWES